MDRSIAYRLTNRRVTRQEELSVRLQSRLDNLQSVIAAVSDLQSRLKAIEDSFNLPRPSPSNNAISPQAPILGPGSGSGSQSQPQDVPARSAKRKRGEEDVKQSAIEELEKNNRLSTILGPEARMLSQPSPLTSTGTGEGITARNQLNLKHISKIAFAT